MQTILAAILAAILSTPALAGSCVFVSPAGDTIAAVSRDDFDREFTPSGGEPVGCVTLRGPDQTTLACENGVESEIFLATSKAGITAMYFNHAIFFEECAPR
jgi:hypothetical protein